MILFDGIIFSLQSHGGISTYFAEILKRSASIKHEQQLLLYQHNELSAKIDFTGKIKKVTPRILERYRDIPINNNFCLAHSSYYRLLRGPKALNIVTVHDFTYEYYRTGWAKAVHSWQKMRAIRRADAIICISDSTYKDLLYFCPNVDTSKVCVIPQAASETYRPIEGISSPAEKPYALFIGARKGYKNFIAAVNAVKQIPNLWLFIVGGGALQPDEKLLLDQSLPGRYKTLGTLGDEQLNMHYNRAHALLYPSSYEGFGIPVIEAMRAGCPVIAVRESSIPEVAGNAACLLESPDPELIASELLALFETDKRQTMRARGFVQAELFSWEKTFLQTVKVYEQLLGKTLLQPNS